LTPLHNHPASSHPDLLVGTSTSDDAGVFRIAPDQALVQTVDFFTPIVDDAYDWGRITAANALSDVYAMGARPLTALQLLGWPRNELPFELLGDVVRGGADVMVEAGCVIIGGHSIDDQEPKYGFAVTGTVHPDRIVTNAGAAAGDRLVITKPLGTGIAATAIKAGACPEDLRATVTASMVSLNADAAEAMVDVGVNAATDVTGFGLGGHLREMLTGSGVSAVIDVEALPVFDGVRDLLAAGHYPGGSARNLASIDPFVRGEPDHDIRRIIADAQTSGGLLISVPEDAVDDLISEIGGRGSDAWVIGTTVDDSSGTITLR
jgi:selenide,water dikinase